MKEVLTALLIVFVLQSCNKNRIEHTLYTNVWDVTSPFEDYIDYGYIQVSEFYNIDGLLIKVRYIYKNKDAESSFYEYNENNQLIEFVEENSGSAKFFYDGDVKIKKQYIDSAGIIGSYEMYEYKNGLTDKIKRYDQSDNLFSIIYNYYSSNRLDSTYVCSTNLTDSIYRISKYSYNDNNNTMEEDIWQSSLFYPPENSELVYYSKIITWYDDAERVIKIEEISQTTTNNFVHEYEYDSFGKMIKKEYYFNDELSYCYSANYSDDDKNHFIIPEL